METKDILKKVDMLDIDSRISLIVGSYFCAKVKSGELTEETIDAEIEKYTQKVKHFEFIKSAKFKVLYEQSGGIITINKNIDTEELVPLVFTKIEEALNTPDKNQSQEDNEKDVLLHIKSFQKGMQLAKELNLPCNQNLEDINNILVQTFGQNGDSLNEEIGKDRGVEFMCQDADRLLNSVIAKGEDATQAVNEIVNLYRYKILTDRENGIDITSDSYKTSLQTVIDSLHHLDKNGLADIAKCEETITRLAQEMQISLEDIMPTENTHQVNKTENEKNIRLYENISKRREVGQEELSKENIEKRVSELIKRKPGFDRRIGAILPQFFVRSAIIYNWNKDDFEQRINSIDSTLNKIGFNKMGIYTAGDTALDEIRINSRFYLNSKGKINSDKELILSLVKTFFHEAGHNTDTTKREGVVLKDKLSQAYSNNMFYEWSNTVFERAIMGKVYEDESGMFLNQNAGYETMANVGSMISAALDINEIDFARLKDSGLEHSKEFFGKNFSYYPDLYEKIKTTFMVSSPKSEGKEAKKGLQQMYKNVYDLCIDVLDARIENDMQTGKIENLEEYQEKQKYLLKKINLNYERTSKKYGQRIEARKVTHKTAYTTDKIDKKSLRKIGSIISKEGDFQFDNSELISAIRNGERTPTLKERLKIKFGRVKALEAGKTENIKMQEREDQEISI